jgi:hypothetical protein
MIGQAAAVQRNCAAKTVRGARSRHMSGMSMTSPYSHMAISHGLVHTCASSIQAEKVKQLNAYSAGSRTASHFADEVSKLFFVNQLGVFIGPPRYRRTVDVLDWPLITGWTLGKYREPVRHKVPGQDSAGVRHTRDFQDQGASLDMRQDGLHS